MRRIMTWLAIIWLASIGTMAVTQSYRQPGVAADAGHAHGKLQ